MQRARRVSGAASCSAGAGGAARPRAARAPAERRGSVNRGRRRSGAARELRAPYALFTAAASSSPNREIASSRILYFCTLPVTVIGKPSVKTT